ncbi:UDP-GlcNAc:betaGal beta-1,3-N-acetylglucosaminyltransferase-like protein 1 [Aethina tumida]|uniref:UDP-GlcNAc:betaGal beta-1,3-N-acetylglucosaminyltransferase-like protein 1 n=1 Tax=Aethina tumida TaxID=116153 RepID=UPI002148470B|nr:UDP-GlcNAc:betaGal beta-1,3-N-acetylglucosaminyltransferase-like protein 1 [Aethina tumida]
MNSIVPIISIIIPIHNGSQWINQCFQSIFDQTALKTLKIEICVCNDASTDDTLHLLSLWKVKFNEIGVYLNIFNNPQECGGVGYSKNKAVSISTGKYLCFQDVDDVMLPNRVLKQYETAISLPNNTLIGSRYTRHPNNSTERYTKWANSLSEFELHTQVYTSFGPTIIMPTWFCHRELFERVGGFQEVKEGCPEDLIFFYKHLDMGGKVYRVDEPLLVYTYHLKATTFSVKEKTIWDVRLERLQRVVLSQWGSFTIWNAGKQGRHFYNSLDEHNQKKVVALCDVDKNKIGKKYEPFDAVDRKIGRPVPIISYKEAQPPFVICVKIDLTNGDFESNLKSLNLQEGRDYVWFS